MTLVTKIAEIRATRAASDDDKRRQVYEVKTTALIDVILHGKPAPKPIPALLGRTITHKGFSFCINDARVTDQLALYLDVTFTKPPADSVTHQITLVNPPVLPSEETRSGNEKQDLIQALHEMLEGFV